MTNNAKGLTHIKQLRAENYIIFFKMVVIHINLYYDVFNGLRDTNHYISGATFLEVPVIFLRFFSISVGEK